MTFTAKELRTKTIYRSTERPNYTIETTHLIGVPKTYKIYETQRITELHTTSECVGIHTSLKEAIAALTWWVTCPHHQGAFFMAPLFCKSLYLHHTTFYKELTWEVH